MRRFALLVFAALFTVAVTSVADAQSGGDFDLSWNAVSSSGGSATGGDFALIDTVGVIAGPPMTGGDFELQDGFLAVTLADGTPLLEADVFMLY